MPLYCDCCLFEAAGSETAKSRKAAMTSATPIVEASGSKVRSSALLNTSTICIEYQAKHHLLVICKRADQPHEPIFVPHKAQALLLGGPLAVRPADK